MALSPSARQVLDQLARLPPSPDFATIRPTQAAAYIAASRAATAVAKPGEDVAFTIDVALADSGQRGRVADSGQRGRVYVPEGAQPNHGAALFFHGGGWVTGSIEMTDDACRYLANRSRCVVVSAAYRRAPEDPFPAAAVDAYCALRWLGENAGDFGADGTRIAIVGVSAGGNLAAAACLQAGQHRTTMPRLQVLLYPALDATRQSPSMQENATGYALTADQMHWFWRNYIGTATPTDPLLSPLHAVSFADQPRALIITAEHDPLRDDGERYARRLQDDGVSVELHRVTGQIHSFMGFIDAVPEARACWQLVADRLREVLT